MESSVCRVAKPGRETSTGKTSARLGTFGCGSTLRGAGGVLCAECAVPVPWAEACVQGQGPGGQRAGSRRGRPAFTQARAARLLGCHALVPVTWEPTLDLLNRRRPPGPRRAPDRTAGRK